MTKEEWKKYISLGLIGCGILAFGIVFYFILKKIDVIFQVFRVITQILMPIIYGVILAYLITPIYNFFEKKLKSYFGKKIKREQYVHRISKSLSITITMLLTFTVVMSLFAMIIPQMAISIQRIISGAPKSYEQFLIWADHIASNNKGLKDFFVQSNFMGYMERWFYSSLMPAAERVLHELTNGIISSIGNFLTVIKNVLIGVIVAIYVLGNKDKFVAQAKKLTYSIWKEKQAKVVIQEVRYAHKMFIGFIGGKLLDSLIIGIICFVVMNILDMPYITLISVIIGVTNIVPFFGPFIGAVPTALFILMEDPIKCLYFLIFIFLLQQFDGNILGPKILGDFTGISSFWVLFSILFFGGLLGFVGMIVGVPAFAIFYNIVSRLVNRSLRKKNMSTDTDDYQNI